MRLKCWESGVTYLTVSTLYSFKIFIGQRLREPKPRINRDPNVAEAGKGGLMGLFCVKTWAWALEVCFVGVKSASNLDHQIYVVLRCRRAMS